MLYDRWEKKRECVECGKETQYAIKAQHRRAKIGLCPKCMGLLAQDVNKLVEHTAFNFEE